MTIHYVLPLKNFPLNPFSSSYELSDYPKYYNLTEPHILHSDIHLLLSKFNLGIDRVSIFTSNGYQEHKIHMDGHRLDDFAKIVWVFGSRHVMNWYRPLKQDNVPGTKILNSGVVSYFSSYEKTDVELLHSHSITTPVLLQAGIPHNVVNYEGSRVALTIVPKLLDKNKIVTQRHLTMHQAMNIFREYLDTTPVYDIFALIGLKP